MSDWIEAGYERLMLTLVVSCVAGGMVLMASIYGLYRLFLYLAHHIVWK